PDPTRYISGKHAEIRWRDGAYWLHDVSTNGTLLNGADHRMQAPHRLTNGDRFSIGHYIIAVALDGEQGELPSAQTPAAAQRGPGYEAIWDSPSDAAPPVDRDQIRAPRDRPRPVNPDFLDWAADVQIAPPESKAPSQAPALAEDTMDWSAGPRSPQPPPPPPPPDLPNPRRPQMPERNHPGQAGSARQSSTPVDRQARSSAVAGLSAEGPALEVFDAFLQHLATAVGVPKELLASKDPGQIGDEIGAVLRV